MSVHSLSDDENENELNEPEDYSGIHPRSVTTESTSSTESRSNFQFYGFVSVLVVFLILVYLCLVLSIYFLVVKETDLNLLFLGLSVGFLTFFINFIKLYRKNRKKVLYFFTLPLRRYLFAIFLKHFKYNFGKIILVVLTFIALVIYYFFYASDEILFAFFFLGLSILFYFITDFSLVKGNRGDEDKDINQMTLQTKPEEVEMKKKSFLQEENTFFFLTIYAYLSILCSSIIYFFDHNRAGDYLIGGRKLCYLIIMSLNFLCFYDMCIFIVYKNRMNSTFPFVKLLQDLKDVEIKKNEYRQRLIEDKKKKEEIFAKSSLYSRTQVMKFSSPFKSTEIIRIGDEDEDEGEEDEIDEGEGIKKELDEDDDEDDIDEKGRHLEDNYREFMFQTSYRTILFEKDYKFLSLKNLLFCNYIFNFFFFSVSVLFESFPSEFYLYLYLFFGKILIFNIFLTFVNIFENRRMKFFVSFFYLVNIFFDVLVIFCLMDSLENSAWIIFFYTFGILSSFLLFFVFIVGMGASKRIIFQITHHFILNILIWLSSMVFFLIFFFYGVLFLFLYLTNKYYFMKEKFGDDSGTIYELDESKNPRIQMLFIFFIFGFFKIIPILNIFKVKLKIFLYNFDFMTYFLFILKSNSLEGMTQNCSDYFDLSVNLFYLTGIYVGCYLLLLLFIGLKRGLKNDDVDFFNYSFVYYMVVFICYFVFLQVFKNLMSLFVAMLINLVLSSVCELLNFFLGSVKKEKDTLQPKRILRILFLINDYHKNFHFLLRNFFNLSFVVIFFLRSN